MLVCLVGAMLFFRSGSWGVTETSEARYAEISREMMETGDIIHPTLLGIGHYHKPPLTYVLTAFSYKLWGATPFGARFLLQISTLLQLILVYRLGSMLLKSPEKALVAAMIYVSFPAVIVATRDLTTDNFLTTFILAAIYFWFKYRMSGKASFIYGFYLSLALGFLTKGPLVLIVPLLVVIPFNYQHPSTKSNTWHHLAALGVFLVVGFSWYLKLALDNPLFWDYFINDHTVQRLTNAQRFRRSEPFWYYLLIVPLTCIPWFFAIVASLARKSKQIGFKTTTGLIAMWIFPSLFFFSLSSSKLFLYVLPIYSGIALAAAHFLFEMNERQMKLWNWIQMIYHLVVLIAVLVVPGILEEIKLSRELILIVMLMFLILIAIQLIPTFKMRQKLVMSALGFTLSLTVLSTVIFSQNQLAVNSTEPLASFIRTHHLQDHTVMVYNRILPSLAFDLQKPIISLFDGHYTLDRETQFEKDMNWKNNLLNLQTSEGEDLLRERLKSEVVLVSKRGLPENRKWIAESFKNEFRMGDWIIYYNLQ